MMKLKAPALASLAALSILIAGCSEAEPAPQPDAVVEADDTEAQNIATVRAFYDAALNQKDAQAALEFLGPEYVQHNPAAQDGAAGLEGFVNFLSTEFPENNSEIVRAFADGDHVILHVRNQRGPDQPVNAIMEIFRLEDGKIVEHWDVIQPVPEDAANDNGMF